MEDKKTNQDGEFDLEMLGMFMGEDGAQILSTDDLKEINKKLPKWNIKPPAKYSAAQKNNNNA